MATATLTIDGMHCAACAFRIERALRKVPGALKADVNLGTRRAHVEFEDGKLSEAALHQAIRENGYEVIQDGAVAEPRERVRQKIETAKSRNFSLSGSLRRCWPSVVSWWSVRRGSTSAHLPAAGHHPAAINSRKTSPA
jgi:copper chaperone CopZ